MHNLLTSLEQIHSKGLIHRDVKPNNFLYSIRKKRGYLIDFGVAEYYKKNSTSVEKGDPKREGTRGFRAPEILVKHRHQTPAIDIWSSGIIFLCLLTRRYPFFHPSPVDDMMALGQLMNLVGWNNVDDACASMGLLLLKL
eukprot:c10641_g1_i2.p1 GENE.c10641_g1_i2~~c10641_g1_i2.p1  ORF type:complete len:140 (+),score=37.81 c10641_g1_i2:73-492(+)